MHITTLQPELRKNLRDLLQGYVEHCEFSEHLTGRIEFPIYFMGFKYGAPLFTHVGPGQPWEDRPVIGFIGWNTPSSRLASQVLLQFIEILTQHPRFAGNSVLRMLPVANPVALELDEDAPDQEDWDLLRALCDRFKEQSTDGFIEIEAADVEDFTLAGEVGRELHGILEKLGEIIPAIRGRIAVPSSFQLTTVGENERWTLRLLVPKDKDDSRSIHAVARFLIRIVGALSRSRRTAVHRDS